MDKNCLGFGDLDPISKVFWGQSVYEIALSAPYLLMDGAPVLEQNREICRHTI